MGYLGRELKMPNSAWGRASYQIGHISIIAPLTKRGNRERGRGGASFDDSTEKTKHLGGDLIAIKLSNRNLSVKGTTVRVGGLGLPEVSGVLTEREKV